MSVNLDALINDAELTVLGAENWLQRARSGEIKTTPDAIDRRAERLTHQRNIVELLRWLRDKQRAGKAIG